MELERRLSQCSRNTPLWIDLLRDRPYRELDPTREKLEPPYNELELLCCTPSVN